jgi:hypothetical protein
VTRLVPVRRFLARLVEFERRHADRQSDRLRSFLARWQSCLPELQAADREVERLHAPRFNVFYVLRWSHRETLVHTPVIGDLLHPRGLHGQGFLFLNGFLARAAQRGLCLPSRPVEGGRWDLSIEWPAGRFGSLDIVLRCAALHYLIVIENKVGAKEQEEQLRRYARWMEKQRHAYNRRQLIFLTPEGRDPYTIDPRDCVCMSYREDISQWLRGTRGSIGAPHVRDVLDRYLEVIEAL